MRCAPWSIVLVGLAGCGLGLGDPPTGGGDELPTLGAGPYGKLPLDLDTPADEPFVIADNQASFRDPAALFRGDGGYRIWFGHSADDGSGDSAIGYAELPALTELPDRGPEVVVRADQAWEDGRVAAPAVIEDGERLLMYYEAGRGPARATGLAESIDGGTTWQKHHENPVSPLFAPTVARAGPRWIMYGTLPAEPGIWRATSTDGLVWELDARPVLTPRYGLVGAFDAARVADPFVAVRETAAGRLHFGLFFNGSSGTGEDAPWAIGHAGSFDGRTWTRFSGLEPVLEGGVPSERAPSVLLTPSRGVLFFQQERQRRQRIGVAVHP